jgi:hypothetical protein
VTLKSNTVDNQRGATHDTAFSVPYIIGGIIGAVLLFVLFDWWLIVLSSCEGRRQTGRLQRYAESWLDRKAVQEDPV